MKQNIHVGIVHIDLWRRGSKRMLNPPSPNTNAEMVGAWVQNFCSIFTARMWHVHGQNVSKVWNIDNLCNSVCQGSNHAKMSGPGEISSNLA